MTDRFDILILGGGNAGFGVSAIAAEAGKSIAFVEELDFGGTCPNRGCTPKKVLVAAAHALHEIETAKAHGIQTGPVSIDWGKLIDREQGMIANIPDMMAGLAAKRGTVFRGTAKFVGPNAVEVNGQRLEADNIVIATGSTPRPLPIPGAELLITSDEMLSERGQPGEVVFIGGGVIAMEFSHVYARAGTKVTILEAMPRLLPAVDQDAVAAIRTESERIGIAIKTDVRVTRIEQAGDRLRVVFDHDGAEHSLAADRIVNGAGRVANVAGLDLDAGGIKHDRIRIEVDEHLRSVSNPAVWVAGDALVGPAQLSPLATYEGRIVGQNIVAQSNGEAATHKPDYSVVPSGIYTVPAMSSVGLTEAQAAEQGLDVTVTVNDMTGWFSAKTYAESVAWVKTLVENGSGRIVGAHLIGHHGEDLIHMFAMAMKYGITAAQIKDQLFAFPTFSADMKSMV
jgi:glutathione reductase (NADPH)